MMLLLFEALEEFAPEVFQSLEEDVLLATPEHLRPLTTGNGPTRQWSESFERWQRRHHLDRWETEVHSVSFESVADLILAGLETSRRSNSDRTWSNWKSTLGLVLSPIVTASTEWRILEAVDPELVESLRIEAPRLEPWNPVLEPWTTWKQRAVQALDGYQQVVEDAFRTAGAEHRQTKRKTRDHFDWLVRYQVREEEYKTIANAVYDERAEPDDDPEARIRKAVLRTAGLIGLRLRPRRGRSR